MIDSDHGPLCENCYHHTVVAAWDWIAANTTHAVLHHRTAQRMNEEELAFSADLQTVCELMRRDAARGCVNGRQ